MEFVGLVDLVFQTLVSFRVLKIASDVIDTLRDSVPEFQVHRCRSVFGNLLTQHFAKTLRAVVVSRKANDSELFRKQFVLSEIAKRWDELALGEVASRSENNHYTGRRFWVHVKMIQAHEKGFLSSRAKGLLEFLVSGLLFDVPAELEAHRRQNFCRKIVFAARSKPLKERRGQHGRRRGGFDGGEDGPATLAGIGDAAGKALESGLVEQGNGGQIEQPGSDNAAAAPHFRDVRKIEIVLIVFRIAERGGFRVGFAMRLAGVGMLENVQAFGVSGHQAVLDAVVHHLDEVAGAGRAAVKITFFGSARHFVAAGSAINVAAAGRERFENRIEALHNISLAANHLAIAALKAPNAAAGADIAIVNSFRGEFFRAADIIDVVRIAAVDDHIVFLELAHQIVQRSIDYRGWHHKPYRTGLLEFLDEVIERSRARCPFPFELPHGIGATVIDDALVTVFLQAPHHIGAHSP